MKTSNWPGGALPGRTINEAGNVYGRLTVLDYAGSNARNEAMWRCNCPCGREAYASGPKLRKGHTASCGCAAKEATTKRNTTHGMRDHELYWLWAGIKARCTNDKHSSHKYYGERGIEMCDRWANDFTAFVQDMGPRPKGATIDRIDPNGNYEPGNCRWATRKEQANNKRTNRLITHNGKTQTIAEWAEETGIHYNTLHRRIRTNRVSIEQALTRPAGRLRK